MNYCRHALFVAAAVIGLMFASPTNAQREPSANAIALSKEFVEITGIVNPFRSIYREVIESVAILWLQSNPALAKDLRDITENLVNQYLPRRDELANEMIKSFASRFTEQELKDLVAFYKSPLGKKLQAELQNTLQDMGQKANVWSAKLREEITPKFREELKKRGHNL